MRNIKSSLAKKRELILKTRQAKWLHEFTCVWTHLYSQSAGALAFRPISSHPLEQANHLAMTCEVLLGSCFSNICMQASEEQAPT